VPRYGFRGMGSRSDNLGADVGGSTDTFGSFDRNNSEIGTDGVARQMHQQTVQQ